MEQPGLRQVSLFVIEADGREVLITPVLDTQPVFIIGSDPRAALRIDDPAVATSHAVIKRSADVYSIDARYPTAETRVNGKRVTAPTPLKPGDVVQIGATTLRFAQEARRVQATTVKPPAATQAALPAKTVGSYPAAALALPSDRALEIPEDQVIYFPKVKKETGGSGWIPLLVGLLVLVVVGVVGYGVIQFVNASVPQPQPVNFAYNDGNIAVMLFDASNCDYCEQQKPILRQVADEFRGDVYVQSYSLDHRGNWPLAQQYEIEGIPTIIIFDDQGQIFTTFPGLIDEETLRGAFQAAIQASATN